MFIGQYQHHLEEKGRLSIPKKFRSQLEAGAVLSRGLDGCLFLHSKVAWEALITKLSRLPLTRSDARNFVRTLSYGAVEVEIDRLGRILIPDFLRDYANIGSNCVVAGAIERIEIWDAVKFGEFDRKISSQAEEIAEKISQDIT